MKKVSYQELENRGFLLKEDAKSIYDYVNSKNIMVSFRNAGSATLNQLKRGAAAKGHDILDKTIKAKSLGLPGDSPGDLNAALNSAINAPTGSNHTWDLLGGFVACWCGNVPIGLYLSKFACKEWECNDWKSEDVTDKKGVVHKVLMLDQSSEFINRLKTKYGEKFPRLFYTGDYDMHDLIQLAGAGSSIVPSDSKSEHDIITEINQRIYKNLRDNNTVDYNHVRADSMETTINEKDREKQEYQMIRHGAQVSYLAHMGSAEPSEEIVYTVADKTTGEEIAACSKNDGWVLFSPDEYLNTWYNQHGVKLKMTWLAPDKLNEAIAHAIANRIYAQIQATSDNKFSSDWLHRNIGARIATTSDQADIKQRIINLTLNELTGSRSGARLRKIGDEYERTIPVFRS